MKKSPDPVDKHVGARVRMRRMLIGMTQEKLGESLNLTFQQVQKYEKGANRIGASRLQQIAAVLGVPVEFFFEGTPQTAATATGFKERDNQAHLVEFLNSPEAIQLNRAFMSITDLAVRRRIVELVVTLAGENEKP